MDSAVIMAIAMVVIIISGALWAFKTWKWPSDPWLIQRKADKELDRERAKWLKEWEKENRETD